MNPMSKIPWGFVLQWALILVVGMLLVKFVATNFIGVIVGAVVGAYITRNHYLKKIGSNNAHRDLGYGQDAYYGQPDFGAQAYQPALTAGIQAQLDQGYGQYDAQPAGSDQNYTCGTCGGQLYRSQQHPDYFQCQGCGQHYQ